MEKRAYAEGWSEAGGGRVCVNARLAVGAGAAGMAEESHGVVVGNMRNGGEAGDDVSVLQRGVAEEGTEIPADPARASACLRLWWTRAASGCGD